MDGTKRTAFTTALYFLEQTGHAIPHELPLTEVVEFCVAIAEENMRLSAGEPIHSRSIADIAAWFRELLSEIA